MMPRGVLKFPDGSNLHYIGYARIRAFQDLPKTIQTIHWQLDDDIFVFFTFSESGETYELAINAKQNPTLKIEMDSLFSEDFYVGEDLSCAFSSEESLFMSDCQKLAISILLAMNARPELISNGHCSGKHKKTGTEIWTPNVVGNGYRLPTNSVGTPGESGGMRFHWRRGH